VVQNTVNGKRLKGPVYTASIDRIRNEDDFEKEPGENGTDEGNWGVRKKLWTARRLVEVDNSLEHDSTNKPKLRSIDLLLVL